MIPVTVFAGRTVALFGLGMSGIASALALEAGGAMVAAWDDSEASRGKAAAAGLTLTDLRKANWKDFAALVLAPGVPLTHPEPHWTVEKAKAAGVEIIGDTELFFRERAKTGSKARVVAITGTNGKSTTTALVSHLCAAAGLPVSLGGNIGRAILDLEPFEDGRVYVIEFSSYQIDLTPGLKADAAALLNITPDHLDRHGTLENYAAVKARIFSALEAGDRAVVSIDDVRCRAIADALKGPFVIDRISTRQGMEEGVRASGGELIEMREGREAARISLEGIGSLRGEHNAQNAAAAYALTRALGLAPETIAKGLRSFPGLEHRMEQVGRMGHVLFVNDSKGTNADAAAHALSSFDDIYWIAGGLAKSGGIEALAEYFPKIRRAYLIGKAADDFARTLEGRADHVICGTLERAVKQAAEDASRSRAKEAVVLLSPACASFDQFPNFMARGDAFRDTVSKLTDVRLLERVSP
ncbi:MAG: UDP-N-acetylmuramoyl-L-alanine--D-glutamate ligase [Hyphomicrobiales bacterium]